MDITDAIQDDHAQQRRLFAVLQQIPDEDAVALAAVWARLSDFLEAHAKAEELHFYPELLKLGQGAGDSDSAEDETRDAIGDHNDIRDAIGAVARHPVGTAAWRKAVAEAEKANSDHMAEEERQGLADFRLHAGLTLRHELAIRFIAFQARHPLGVAPVNQDPDSYVRRQSPAG